MSGAMITEEMRAHARSLVLAMELGTSLPTVLDRAQQLVCDLGGKIDVRALQPGSAAIYLVALLFSAPDRRH